MASVRRSLTGEFPSERKVRTKHGTVTTMDTSNIGKRDAIERTLREELRSGPIGPPPDGDKYRRSGKILPPDGAITRKLLRN